MGYRIPSSPKKIPYTIDSFMGVDFTSSPIEVDKRRSPNAKNIINKDGYNESRNGYNVLNTIGNKINGVWNFDYNGEDYFIVHSGTKLYECSRNFQQSTVILTDMSDNITQFSTVYIEGYLMIFDGTRTVVYGNFGNGLEAKFLDTVGYIPVTSIARNSSGGGTDYEKPNLICPSRINYFLSEKITEDNNGQSSQVDQTEFILEDSNIIGIELVEVLNQNGEWDVVPASDYTFDSGTSTVTFINAPGESPVLGRDNVKIQYRINNSDNANKINKCNVITLYGYEGNGNRIFATGNPDLPNYDYHCEEDNPLYWPDENFTKFGTEPIVAYSILNDGSLSIHKKQSDTDKTVYFRTYNLLNSQEIFPIKDGVKNIGCISKYCNCNLLNDPLILSNQGVFAIIGNNGEKFAQQRSYYVNGKLLKEEHLENAIAITVDGKYYLAVNNHMYIADSRYLSYPKHSKTEQYQYEWWYWDNIPARILFSWNNELYFGTVDGKICKFNDGYEDIDTPVQAYWETPFLELNSSSEAKTIKSVTLTLNPHGNTDITFGYILDDGTINIITKEYRNLADDFPKTIQEKEKIKKFMFVKFFMRNNTINRMTFERLILEYIKSGKYRGD